MAAGMRAANHAPHSGQHRPDREHDPRRPLEDPLHLGRLANCCTFGTELISHEPGAMDEAAAVSDEERPPNQWCRLDA